MNQDRGMCRPSRRWAGAPRWRRAIARLSALALLAPGLCVARPLLRRPELRQARRARRFELARGRSALDQDHPRGLPELVDRLPRSDAQPSHPNRLRPEPDPDGGRRARPQGARDPRRGDRRGLSAEPSSSTETRTISSRRAQTRRPTPTTCWPRTSGTSISAARSGGKSTCGASSATASNPPTPPISPPSPPMTTCWSR